ncbi:exopolyphosphatase/guanosine-5'-triphosphate,3'-diphosphate pyrophosphatase [Pedobacter sp. AK017]|uniref:Ppx/GppA phosphatase family protein n=1 Tax=Pedobacter sp. AK017 TaxID=2723073 RepID=UPI001618461A|nr:exopolyphosphatase [Pedobacter sp. AK017]MBB5439444.1 exopolyphosphatase/guanosine-5'-triphosphate,3'-diphosphate pyrophosphatase [Pedobacter sp. AK017]
MTAAVIDLGTNTFHLVIAKITADGIQVIYKTNLPVKLGEGRINDNIIIPEAYARGLQALQGFYREIEKYQVDVVKAIATSAIRSAANGSNFVNSAKSDAGIDIEVITGDKEAEYIFKGVKATGAIKGTCLIMDIGGGSTEFIICNPDGLHWKKSYDIGAARLMQAYFHSDPISDKDQSAIRDHLDKELGTLKTACNTYRPTQLIGSAGAFETFAGMLDQQLDLNKISTADIDLQNYHTLSKNLIASTHAEREQMPDLISLRVDMIVIAAIITDYVLEASGINSISLSTYDLKMGVLQAISESETS